MFLFLGGLALTEMTSPKGRLCASILTALGPAGLEVLVPVRDGLLLGEKAYYLYQSPRPSELLEFKDSR